MIGQQQLAIIALNKQGSCHEITITSNGNQLVSLDMYDNCCCGKRDVTLHRQPSGTMSARLDINDKAVILTLTDIEGLVLSASSDGICLYDDNPTGLYSIDISDKGIAEIFDGSSVGVLTRMMRGQY